MDPTRIRLHRDLVDSQPFQIGSDFAMLQFAGWLATQVSDSNSAMAVGYQLLGAYSYLATLKSLAEIPKVPARIDNANLDHSRS